MSPPFQRAASSLHDRRLRRVLRAIKDSGPEILDVLGAVPLVGILARLLKAIMTTTHHYGNVSKSKRGSTAIILLPMVYVSDETDIALSIERVRRLIESDPRLELFAANVKRHDYEKDLASDTTERQ